jgi:hypothetical protein
MWRKFVAVATSRHGENVNHGERKDRRKLRPQKCAGFANAETTLTLQIRNRLSAFSAPFCDCEACAILRPQWCGRDTTCPLTIVRGARDFDVNRPVAWA